MKLILVALCGFLFGLTWDVSCHLPYYEARGIVSVEQRLLGVKFVYTWSNFSQYPPEWDIYKVK